MADSEQEKTEEPTQQRREDFRKRGQVAQTKELASVFALLFSLVGIWMMGRFFLEQLLDIFNSSFGDFLVGVSRKGDWTVAAQFAVKKAAYIVAPIGGILWVASLASSVLQVGFLVNEEALQFKLNKINPIEGFKRLFSLRSVVEGLKAILKLIVVASIAYFIVRSEVHVLPHLSSFSLDQVLAFIAKLFFKMMGGVAFFMGVLAGVDFLYQKWDLEQQMKMTKQEVKEEHKSREGDPLIKARIRRVQREMSQKRMMSEVPKADVVVTNPTHIAVALKYSDNMVAPMIVAMGADLVAQKIKEIAKEHKVPIVENKPLARTMYKTLKIGQAIPKELYAAVAEVLSYIYSLKHKKKKR